MNDSSSQRSPLGIGDETRGRSPFRLLLSVHLRQSWRRLQSLTEQSPLLLGLIALFIAGYFWIAFWLFYHAFGFLSSFPGLGPLLSERLLFILFAFLFILLLFSNLIISYTNLFRNRETTFLLSLPVPAETIVRWKFLESVLLASWAFLFLISPFLVAYGLVQDVPWHFYPVTLLFLALFIILPGVVGTWLAISVARYMDRRSFQVTALTLAVAILAGFAWWLRGETGGDGQETRVLVILDRLLAKTAFAQFPWLPSYWLASGVLFWSEGAIGTALFFATVLLSYASFFGCLVSGMGGWFYGAISEVHSRGHVLGRWQWFHQRRRRRRDAATDGAIGPVERLIRWIPRLGRDVRALVVKDIRLFWRDTSQWGQSLVLFGLLGVYIINLRQFSQQLTQPFWVHLVAYLNLAACSLNLATLTTRFVYPQFSLEGKRLWIVGLAPLGLERVVRAKFWLALVASMLITLTLVTLSCVMLKMPFARVLYFAIAVTIMCFTLTGMAVGLGVLYPNFKEDNPSKIVSGFGGTFCLVLSFVYILCSVILLAMGSPWGAARSAVGLVMASWAVFLTISFAFGWLPLAIGLRRVRSIELDGG